VSNRTDALGREVTAQPAAQAISPLGSHLDVARLLFQRTSEIDRPDNSYRFPCRPIHTAALK